MIRLFQRDKDYIVKGGEVVIIDEFTGRMMPGRRYSEGLHQALEAKENVEIQPENQTLASITFQNYFRLYKKLAGMTGTADTEAFEFQQIYNLPVVVIPTNKPLARKDFNDLVYLTQEEKFAAIIADIKECREQGRPVLVGTATIETSEYVSRLLEKEGIEHKVLNAKHHEREAAIVADAGQHLEPAALNGAKAAAIDENRTPALQRRRPAFAGIAAIVVMGARPDVFETLIPRHRLRRPRFTRDDRSAHALDRALIE